MGQMTSSNMIAAIWRNIAALEYGRWWQGRGVLGGGWVVSIFKSAIFKLILQNGSSRRIGGIVFMWMPGNLIDDEYTLVPVMA